MSGDFEETSGSQGGWSVVRGGGNKVRKVIEQIV